MPGVAPLVVLTVTLMVDLGREVTTGSGDPSRVISSIITGVGFLGIVLSSLPMYVAGFMDQPGWDTVDYDSSGAAALLNGASAAGHALVALAALTAVAAVVRSKGEAS